MVILHLERKATHIFSGNCKLKLYLNGVPESWYFKRALCKIVASTWVNDKVGISRNPRKASAKPKATGSAIVPYPGHYIKVGSRGKDVQRVQRAVGVNPDGIFGNNTKKAVMAYQKRHGLCVDGIVGKETWKDQNIKRIESSWNELNDINQRFFEASYEVNKMRAL
ncbi:Putative peptidoglycan binding domain-containing protein [Terribacillus aidingensis]|uniref:Putative peptidoglycan binding domain-containing protein n=1 Tax=Terribacillus aidingensis TaxID=586416 RepID=A0A285NS39_9BACI|nr:peptidoglycan-binding domain-containing protein [Terribacillus aidingensis]SNZ10646.1 Putative peptidoglycan binding domain-containing protein [Terribacillus aidingensis]